MRLFPFSCLTTNRAMRSSEITTVLLFFLVIYFQTRGGSAQTTSNAVLTSTLQTWELQCPKATETPEDGQRFCDKTTLCASIFHYSVRCQCDDLCQYYGDCCFDALEEDENPDIVVPSAMELETCQSNGIYGSGYYMISECPEEFVDSTIRSLCEQVNPDDILLNTPATDRKDKKLFRNLYCAICHERIIDNLYFWKLTVTCENEPADSDIEGGKSDSKDDGTFDDGTSAFDDGTAAFDDGTSAFDDGTSAFDDGTSAFDDGTSAFDDGTSAFDDGTSAFDDGTSAFDDGTSAFDDGTSAFDDGTSAFDDGTSAFDDGTSAVDDGTSAVDDGTSAVDDGTSAVDTSARGTIAPPEDLRLLWENLRNPKCFRKFSYRLEGSDPYRRCTPIDVNSFEDDRQMQISCPSYVAPYLSNGTTYKNRECAACNGANVTSSPCDFPNDDLDPQGAQSFSNLFLFSDGYGFSENEVHASPCNNGDILDPFSNACRTVVPRYEPQTEGERDQSDHFMVRGEIYVHESEDVCFSSNTEHCSEIKEAISVVLTALIRSETADFQGHLSVTDIDCVDSSNQIHFCFQEQGPSKLCTFRGDLLSDTPNVYQDLRQRSNNTVRDESYRNLSCLYMPLMNIQTFTLTPGNVSCSSLSSESQTSSIGFVWREELNDTQITSVSGYCSGILTCKSDFVHFNSLDVKVINATHIYISKTEQYFKRGTYYERPDGISICTDYLDVCKAKENSQRIEAIFTIIGSTMSLAGFTATILTYMIFPRLRNNMGKSILSLVSALFVAQFFQLVFWDKTTNTAFCTSVAMISHYTFLAAFFWMSVLGNDLSRTFGSRAKLQTVRDSKKTFFYFSLYGWVGPLIIVGICSVFHFTDVEFIDFWYGNECSCWIGDPMALFWTFGFPVVIIWLLNFVFFADTVIGIVRARNATKRATSSNTNLLNRDGKQDFLLFCKLSCIMGLTWVFSFAAGFFESQAVSIIAITLNSTQGVLIFIAFGCNSRVLEMWRNNYSKRKLTSSRSASMAATTKTSVSSMTGQHINQVRIPRVTNKNPAPHCGV